MTPDPNRTSPVGLVRYAGEFLDCALAAESVVGKRPEYEICVYTASVPVMFLIAHSIELSLKAYLLGQGVPLSTLKKYGHDLQVCLDKAHEHGLGDLLTVSPEELSGMQALNDLYCSTELTYIVTLSKSYPAFDPIQQFAERLAGSVGRQVGYRRRKTPKREA